MFKNKKRIYILSTILIILIIIVCININKKKEKEKFIQQEMQRVLQYSDISDFQNIEEVFLYLNSELLSKEDANIENVDYILKSKIKYNLEVEMKDYYEKLIQYSAYALDYKNFYIIDEDKKISIYVLCDSEKQAISKYYINDEESYFEKMESNQNIGKFSETESIQVNIISEELQQIISKNWQTIGINLGTQDSTYRNYDIYFDEGYEIRKVNGKVFNIIFTDKYNKEIFENIKIDNTKEEIEKMLGKPTFLSNNVFGYKTEKFYMFFSNKQISIYPIVEYNTNKVIEIIEKYKDSEEIQEYINEIKLIWKDYDKYDYGSNYVILQYTLKGICFKYDLTAQNGIVFYNNYSGLIDTNTTLKEIVANKKELPEKMYFENSDLVFEQEKARVATLDDYTEYRNNRNKSILNISKKFKINQDLSGQIRFISINKQSPNSELRENLDYGIWYDDYNFIYSIKGRGIYMYNVLNHKYTTIIEGNDTYQLTGISEGNILYYDETSISVSE